MHPPDSPHDPLAASLHPIDLPPAQISLELLARAQDGDAGALADLLARYEDRLRRIVRIQVGRSPLGRVHDSMDIVQDTFVAALPKIGDLRPRSAASLLHWLAIIATNQVRDALDREFAQKRDVGRRESLNQAAEAACSAFLSRDEVELSEVRELLDAAVTDLPDDQRRVVLLRDYCGESWERVAAELGRENGATRQLHQRAWIQLRRVLRPALEGRSSRRHDAPPPG